ncbi:alpha/beta hydrolase fold domain-containing protein [Cupriavidus sp. CuC1]|uniref:alpha/beta hydrolase fold domain-containing protein n=1 Tax=Cupriavidus sp. CuC1 TaxID=3373131 RepID=UPI0037CD2B56
MGDSAGGGMALALAQVARDTGRALPGRLVLLSPFLDATGSNPAIDALEPLDPMLSKLGGIECGRVYAGGDPVTLPQVSPIYGSLRGLPPVTLFIGTHDVLLPDCRTYRALAEQQGLPLRYYEYEGMFHVWMLLPMPEPMPPSRRSSRPWRPIKPRSGHRRCAPGRAVQPGISPCNKERR